MGLKTGHGLEDSDPDPYSDIWDVVSPDGSGGGGGVVPGSSGNPDPAVLGAALPDANTLPSVRKEVKTNSK